MEKPENTLFRWQNREGSHSETLQQQRPTWCQEAKPRKQTRMKTELRETFLFLCQPIVTKRSIGMKPKSNFFGKNAFLHKFFAEKL